MWQDPIVEEIHAIRAQIAQQCEFDLKKIILRLQGRELEHPERIVQKKTIAEPPSSERE
jgi:hypothetical protein